MLVPRFRYAAGALLLLLAPPLTAQPPAPPRAHPALWVVRGRGTVIWLFGTIHALPPGYQWRDPTLDKAFAEADELIIEAKLGDPAQSAAMFTRLATPAQPLPPLADRVAAKYRPELAQMEAKAALPATAYDGMETWAAAFMLFGISMGDLGLDPASGVEETLKAQFGAAHKPISAFETPEQQLGLFDSLPEAQQRAFLESVLDDPQDDKREFAEMLAAWAKGDEAAIAASFDKDFKASPLLRDVLLARRNAAWADAIAARLQTPGDVLVAVGAGHLAGAQSVVRMLQAKGIKIERVE